mgnify:CR=1 FL=1
MEPDAQAQLVTLSVDCGGGGIKSTLLDAGGFQISGVVRTPVPYPFSPEDMLQVITAQLDEIGGGTRPDFDRITLGMPGMIRRGVVVYTPHYIRRSGPHTRILPDLERAWTGQDMQAAVEARFDVPALILNDAEVAAAGIVSGRGLELVLTLGTGLGSAFLDNGQLAPHLEIRPGRAGCSRLLNRCGRSFGGTRSTSAVATRRASPIPCALACPGQISFRTWPACKAACARGRWWLAKSAPSSRHPRARWRPHVIHLTTH